MQLTPAVALLMLAACADYPRDIGGTLDRVQANKTLRIGYTAVRPRDRSIAQTFVARMERATGAKATTTIAPAEHQLTLLEDGKLDLVLGDFADDTPWIDDVAVIEPLSERREGKRTIGLAAVAANGENRWIMLLEREVRAMRQGPAR